MGSLKRSDKGNERSKNIYIYKKKPNDSEETYAWWDNLTSLRRNGYALLQ